jgi:hypothetical protein
MTAIKRPCKNCGNVHNGVPFTDCATSYPDDVDSYSMEAQNAGLYDEGDDE